MRSNDCNIKKGTTDLTPILAETEKVTKYNGLSQRNALVLRLLAEELVGMLPALVSRFDGVFWVENEGDSYELHVNLFVEQMDALKRDELIRFSSNNKNVAAVGITGKICAVFDYMTMGGDELGMVFLAGKYGYAPSLDCSSLWSLRSYRDTVAPEETERWDELEKSIIAKLSDDVLVGVRGKKVSIVIKKHFIGETE